MARNLLSATQSERQRFVDSFDMVLTDCDRTIWGIRGPLDGVDVAVAKLQTIGKTVKYVSNNAVRTAAEYEQRFQSSNLPATFNDVIHPGTTAIDYLRSIHFVGSIYLIGSGSLKHLLLDAGFDVIQSSSDCIAESPNALWDSVHTGQTAAAVVVDFDYNLSYKQLVRAQLYLTNPKCEFIVCATELVLPFHKPILGPGYFVNMLSDFTKRSPVVVGKPGTVLRDVVTSKFQIKDPKRVLFVGDELHQDIGFGRLAGFQTLAVLTGATTEEAVLNPGVADDVPDFYLPAFADLSTVMADLNL